MYDFTKIDGHRVSKIIYGTIMVLVVLLAMEDHPPSAAGSLALVVMTGIGVALAEFYSDFIGANIEQKHTLTTQERQNIAHDISGVLIGALLPAPFFILAIFGVMALDTAFEFAKWTLVGVLLFYGYVASRLNGHSQLFSIILAVAASTIGLLVVLFKETLGH